MSQTRIDNLHTFSESVPVVRVLSGIEIAFSDLAGASDSISFFSAFADVSECFLLPKLVLEIVPNQQAQSALGTHFL